MNTFIGKQKPLKYQIITHHHDDHLGGVQEVIDLGASFVVLNSHLPSIHRLLEDNVPKERFVLADDLPSLERGAIKLINFSNEHAQNNLISYFVESNVIFTADLFLSRLKSGAPKGYQGLRDFSDLLKQQKIQPTRFAAAHSGRLLTDEDLAYSISHIQREICPPGWIICPQ